MFRKLTSIQINKIGTRNTCSKNPNYSNPRETDPEYDLLPPTTNKNTSNIKSMPSFTKKISPEENNK